MPDAMRLQALRGEGRSLAFRWSHEARLLLLESKSLPVPSADMLAQQLQSDSAVPGHKKSSVACVRGSKQLASFRTRDMTQTNLLVLVLASAVQGCLRLQLSSFLTKLCIRMPKLELPDSIQ